METPCWWASCQCQPLLSTLQDFQICGFTLNLGMDLATMWPIIVVLLIWLSLLLIEWIKRFSMRWKPARLSPLKLSRKEAPQGLQGLPEVLEFLLGLGKSQHPPFILQVGSYRISHNRLWESPIYWIVSYFCVPIYIYMYIYIYIGLYYIYICYPICTYIHWYYNPMQSWANMGFEHCSHVKDERGSCCVISFILLSVLQWHKNRSKMLGAP